MREVVSAPRRRLDLRGQGLLHSNLPDASGDMLGLRELRLYDNHLDGVPVLPDWVAELEQRGCVALL